MTFLWGGDYIDVKSVSIDSLDNFCTSANQVISVTIENLGYDTLANFPLSYRINGGPVVSEMYTASLPPFSSDTYSFASTADLSSPSMYSIEFWTSHVLDQDVSNDTIVYQFINSGTIVTFPHTENFAISDGNWISSGQNPSWMWGRPQNVFIDGAANDTAAWVTNLTGNYNLQELSYLYSSLPGYVFLN